MNLPQQLSQKITQRNNTNALRKLTLPNSLINFSSNDYLGFAQNQTLFNQTHQLLVQHNMQQNGATGSRLLSGNHKLYALAESYIAQFHQAQSALIFNSGYDANLGFFSCIAQRTDVILYDELCHASIRDGIAISHAKAYKYQHNNTTHLQQILKKLTQNPTQPTTIYLVTESVFSMDGDSPNFEELLEVAQKHNAYLVVDEAHALGVFGEKGEGVLQSLQLHNSVFARIVTFGKGLGCHGAAVLGSHELIHYLINFSRSFIYTTALSPHSVASIWVAYQNLEIQKNEIQKLKENIIYFNQTIKQLGISNLFVYSKSAIQSAIIPSNEKVKNIAQHLQTNGFDVKPILSPTVPQGQERLRFCLHSTTTQAQINQVLQLLSTTVFNH